MSVSKDSKEASSSKDSVKDSQKEKEKKEDTEKDVEEKKDEKKEPEPNFEMLTNPARVMRQQVIIYAYLYVL